METIAKSLSPSYSSSGAWFPRIASTRTRLLKTTPDKFVERARIAGLPPFLSRPRDSFASHHLWWETQDSPLSKKVTWNSASSDAHLINFSRRRNRQSLQAEFEFGQFNCVRVVNEVFFNKRAAHGVWQRHQPRSNNQWYAEESNRRQDSRKLLERRFPKKFP